MTRTAAASSGRLDIVVNNSGVARVTPLAEWTPDDWRASCDVNLTGRLQRLPRRRAAPDRAAERARSSTSPRCSPPSGSPATPSTRRPRAAIIALTRALGRRVGAPQHPGQRDRARAGSPPRCTRRRSRDPRIAERLTRDIPARRIGRPEEIGPLAVYLASAASDFMTGQTLFLDGGHTAA